MEEKIAKHRQMMKFCHSHLTHNIFNFCMLHFFFGLVYVVDIQEYPKPMLKLMRKNIYKFTLKIYVYQTCVNKTYLLENLNATVSATMMQYQRMLVACEHADHVRNCQRRILVSNSNCLGQIKKYMCLG